MRNRQTDGQTSDDCFRLTVVDAVSVIIIIIIIIVYYRLRRGIRKFGYLEKN